jgi:hypothetical protein
MVGMEITPLPGLHLYTKREPAQALKIHNAVYGTNASPDSPAANASFFEETMNPIALRVRIRAERLIASLDCTTALSEASLVEFRYDKRNGRKLAKADSHASVVGVPRVGRLARDGWVRAI